MFPPLSAGVQQDDRSVRHGALRRAPIVALAAACVILVACLPASRQPDDASLSARRIPAGAATKRAATERAATERAVTLTDDGGRLVRLDRPARRVISLIPSVNETLVAIGATDRIVGRTRYDVAPELAGLPSVGGGIDPSVEAVLALSPDLVLGWEHDKRRGAIGRLATLGIPVFTLRTQDTTDMFRGIANLGALTGRVPAAAVLATQLRDEFAAIRRRRRRRSPTTVGHGAAMTAIVSPHILCPRALYRRASQLSHLLTLSMIASRLSVRRATTSLVLAALAATPLVAVPLAAQQRAGSVTADSVTADSARYLAPVITTATRAPARADELPQRVTTITHADIERTPGGDVVDLLKKVAGVDVIQYPGLLGYVSVRGFRPSSGTQTRTLVLIDGRPAGAYNLSLIDMSSVHRIEVLRGPASALYGSSAQGGVVNFITRRSTGQLGGTVSAAYGSFATSELMARAGGVIARPGGHAVDADVSVRRYEQGDDFRLGRGGVFRGAVGGETATRVYTGTDRPSRQMADTEGDGLVRVFTTFGSLSGSARVGVALPADLRLDVRGDLFDADDVNVPGDVYARLSDYLGNSRKNVARHTEEMTLRRDIPLDATTSADVSHAPLARLYSAREESEHFDQPGEDGYVNYTGETRTSGLQLQDVMRLGSQSLAVGVDGSRIDGGSRRYERQGAGASGQIAEVGTYSPNSRATSAAVFAQAQLRSPGGRVTGVVGGRLDRVTLDLLATPFRDDVTAGTDRFTVFNPNVGVQVELVSGLRVHATAGRAFLNPDASGLAGYSQVVSDGIASIVVGNPTLSPEHSVTIDGGMSFSLLARGLDLDVTYFATDVEDRISSARATFAAGSRPTTAGGNQISSITTSANSGTARICGLEAEARYDVGRAMRRPFSLAIFAGATRILRAEESTPRAVVDTSGLSSVQELDASVIFGRITLDPTATTTLRIRNVADLTATAGIDYDDFHRFSGRLGARYVGTRLDSDFSDFSDPGDVEYAPSLVLDLTAGTRLAGRYRVEGQVTNLTDENYYEKRGYNLAGRALRLRIAADF